MATRAGLFSSGKAAGSEKPEVVHAKVFFRLARRDDEKTGATGSKGCEDFRGGATPPAGKRPRVVVHLE